MDEKDKEAKETYIVKRILESYIENSASIDWSPLALVPLRTRYHLGLDGNLGGCGLLPQINNSSLVSSAGSCTKDLLCQSTKSFTRPSSDLLSVDLQQTS